VNIYYQLRFRDTASDVEDSLDTPLPIVDFNMKRIDLSKMNLKQFDVLKKSVLFLWSDSALIWPLIPKFFKLTIQVCIIHMTRLYSYIQ
jgi:hypothetical protein